MPIMVRHLAIILVLSLLESQTFAQKHPYQNSNLPVEDRVLNLLSLMSLEEKVRQMDMYRGPAFKTEEEFDAEKTLNLLHGLGVGAIHDLYPRSEEMINQLQEFVINHNRWGIPALIMA